MINKKSNTVIVVAGATASGKSSLALKIAKASNGVIINADSMQIYDELHMLTAHPLKEEILEAPHKLYGALDINEACSAAKWRDMALKTISKAHDVGQLPIVTGGTGFYLKAMMDGLSPIPKIPDNVRQETIDMCNTLGREKFAEELAKLDEQIIKRIDMMNPQRMIRAWEVLEVTGKSLAYWQDLPREGVPENIKFITVVISPKREILYQRCNERFEWMINNGVLDEILSFKAKIDSGEIDKDVALTNALGFWELSAFLAGEDSMENAIEKAQQSTRRYAKRQSTWFKNQIDNAHIVSKTTDFNLNHLLEQAG